MRRRKTEEEEEEEEEKKEEDERGGGVGHACHRCPASSSHRTPFVVPLVEETQKTPARERPRRRAALLDAATDAP